MIVSLHLQNWKSYCDKTLLSMRRTSGGEHTNRIIVPGNNFKGLLPIMVIYGSHASGKTNLVDLLDFVKRFVVIGFEEGEPIPVVSFVGYYGNGDGPVRFKVELLIDGELFEYSFVVSSVAVMEEKLVSGSGRKRKVLYHRNNGEQTFHSSIAENQLLHYAFKETRDNQLFLGSSVSHNVFNFSKVYDWFRDSLEIVMGEAHYHHLDHLINENNSLNQYLKEFLAMLGVGISDLVVESIPIEHMNLNEVLLAEIASELEDGEYYNLGSFPSGDRLTITSEGGRLVALRLGTIRKSFDGEELFCPISIESEGTQRIIDLVPILHSASNIHCEKVFFIDDFDRSLHINHSRMLIKLYLLTRRPECRAQLILTTRNPAMVNQKLLRNDEIRISERDYDGATTLLTLEEYLDDEKQLWRQTDEELLRKHLEAYTSGGVNDITHPGFDLV